MRACQGWGVKRENSKNHENNNKEQSDLGSITLVMFIKVFQTAEATSVILLEEDDAWMEGWLDGWVQ